MAGGNHPKSSASASHRKSRWEPKATATANTATTTTKSPSDPKSSTAPSPKTKSNPNPNPNPNANHNPNRSPANPALMPFPFPEPAPPPAYGFHMLERRTIVLADGSVRSYFALPPDYQDFAPPPRPLDLLGGFDKRFPPGGSLSPGRFRLDGRHPDYRNPLEGSAKRKYGDEGGRDELARQREQLLRNANLNGFGRVPGGEFSAGPSGPLRRDLVDTGRDTELRPSKHLRVDGVNARHQQVDQDALKKAFLHFAKLINENASQKKSYLEDGKQGRLQCVACGRFGRIQMIMSFFSKDCLV